MNKSSEKEENEEAPDEQGHVEGRGKQRRQQVVFLECFVVRGHSFHAPIPRRRDREAIMSVRQTVVTLASTAHHSDSLLPAVKSRCEAGRPSSGSASSSNRDKVSVGRYGVSSTATCNGCKLRRNVDETRQYSHSTVGVVVEGRRQSTCYRVIVAPVVIRRT